MYLLFYQAALQLFKNFNLFLQREDPIIFLLYDQMHSFVKQLMGKFVTVAAIRANTDITCVAYSIEVQLPSKYTMHTIVCINKLHFSFCRLRASYWHSNKTTIKSP